MLNRWIYIFFIKDGDLFYDRTVSRYGAGPARAVQRVGELNKSGFEAFFTIGTLPKADYFS